jgi:hypothetical protein
MGRFLILVVVVATLAISAQASAVGFHGPKDPYTKVHITPRDFVLGKEISIGITRVTSIRESPMANSVVRISYYQGAYLVTERLRTDEGGIVRFTPKVMGKYVVRASGRLLSFVVGPEPSGHTPGNETNRTDGADGSRSTVLYRRLSNKLASEENARVEKHYSDYPSETVVKENPMTNLVLMTITCYFSLLYFIIYFAEKAKREPNNKVELPRETFSVFEIT